MGTVAILDECSLFRGALKALLQKSGETDVRESACPAHAIEIFRDSHVRTAVIDPYFGGNGGGLCLLQNIRREFPKLGVLVCTSSLHREMWLDSIQSGANGFVLKSCPAEEIVIAIRKITRGERYVMGSLQAQILDMVLTNGHTRLARPTLSLRQRQVIERLLQGDPEKEIAAQLGLSVSSVATYLSRALQALGLKNKVELIRFAEAHPELLGHANTRAAANPN